LLERLGLTAAIIRVFKGQIKKKWARNCEDACLILGDSEGQEGAFVSPDFGASFLQAMVKDSRTPSCAVQQCVRVTAYDDPEEKPIVHEEVRRVQPTRCNFSQFIYFCKTLYMFQTGFPSIIRRTKLHIRWQVFVRPILLPAASLAGKEHRRQARTRY